MYGSFSYRQPEVTDKNVDWLIFQILRSEMISKINADTLIRNHRMNWIKPESLKDHELDRGPSVVECLTMKVALTAFSTFIREIRKEFENKKGNVNDEKKEFVNSIIDTYIEVNENKIKLYTYNNKLLLRIKDAVKAENYSFKVIKFEEVAKCLAQTMNEN